MGDPGADLYPVKEQSNEVQSISVATFLSSTDTRPRLRAYTAQKAKQMGLVAKLSRDDLEDKYLRLYEENILLKKHARKQEDKIKRMATKLLRLTSDKKRGNLENHDIIKKGRDIETEEMLEDLHSRIYQLEKQNNQLREKLLVTKQQLTVSNKKTAYGYVPARIDTGIPKRPVDPRISKQIRVSGPPPSSTRLAQTPHQPRYGHSLLEDARAENRQLEDAIDQLHEQINIYEQDIEALKEQMRIRESEFEEDLLKIKQQMSVGQRTTIQENIDIIKLQREVKEKATKLVALQGQFANVEDKLRAVKASHDQVLAEMERVNHQLKEEQNKNLRLTNELKSGSSSERRIVELQERAIDLEKECDILKEANEKLVNSAFDLEREREWRQKEQALKVQIAQLEATLKADVGEKGSILDKLNDEKDEKDKLEEEHHDLRIKYFENKQELDDLKDKMRFFTQESAVDFQEIEEALLIIKERKEKNKQEDLDFLGKVEVEQTKDYKKLILELQAEHADTINELEKTRNMLIMQHKINKDYQLEVTSATNKMEENRAEYETKLEEYAQLLDIRAARIRKLESQLRDVAYGTRQFRIRPEEDDEEDTESLDETIHLERGQNMFEIHIKRITLSQDGLRHMGDDEPNIFCTWEFYEHEIQATPVKKGPKAEYQFTSQYLVKVDDFFLHYLQRDSTVLEVHHSMGTDYLTVAACQLKLKEILDQAAGRHHGSVTLVGVNDEGVGVNFGVVEYWVRLRVPMAQAMRLYKERSKALGYIDTNQRMASQALEVMDEDAARRPLDNVNELSITVNKCQGIQARREGVQPSTYAVYKFFDFDDHDTTIVAGSNEPQFNDHKVYPVPMTVDLDKYLKTQPLIIYIFDDTDPEVTTYLGAASIPLIPLAHDKHVRGTFELKNREGELNGTLEASLRWKFNYIPPKAASRTPAQQQLLDSVGPPPEEKLPLLPGEEEQLAGAPPMFNPALSFTDSPVAVSTPIKPSLRFADQEPERDESIMRPVALSRNMEEQATPTELVASPAAVPAVTVTSPGRDDGNESIISEGSHVSGESRTVSDSDDEEDLTPRGDEGPMSVNNTRLQEETVDDLIRSEMAEKEETVDEGEEVDEEIPSEENILEEEEEEASPGLNEEEGLSEDSEGLVVVASPHHSANFDGSKSDTVTIMLSHISLDEGSRIIEDESIQILFIEYRFIGVPLQETETPFSLPKPKPGGQIQFNFHKVFHIDHENNYERRQFLASMLLPDDPEEGRIRFTVVSEPPEDNEDAECEDVGVAIVSIPHILASGRDIVDEDVPIFDIQDESVRIGTMHLTVECLAALQAIKEEIESGTE